MEDHAVEEPVLSEEDEVVDGRGCSFCIESNDERTDIGLHGGGIRLGWIDGHGRRTAPLRFRQSGSRTLGTACGH